jgi:hypothetical protein|tara:strand:- start:961 stop:1140 length:180 start_codon:yes stop_codon:yes gene_type:complete
MENKVIPNVTATLIAALEDIKEVISQDPSRENVGQSSLTLVRIYDIVEEVQKRLNLQHK